MGSLFDVFKVVKNLAKAMRPGDKIVECLNRQQTQGVRLSPKLRNALAMYALMKTNPPEVDGKEFLSFSDSNWYYLDILDEIEANPSLLPSGFEKTFASYKSCVKAAQEAGERGFDQERAKWEKKNHCTYQPKPRPNLIGEPLG